MASVWCFPLAIMPNIQQLATQRFPREIVFKPLFESKDVHVERKRISSTTELNYDEWLLLKFMFKLLYYIYI